MSYRPRPLAFIVVLFLGMLLHPFRVLWSRRNRTKRAFPPTIALLFAFLPTLDANAQVFNMGKAGSPGSVARLYIAAQTNNYITANGQARSQTQSSFATAFCVATTNDGRSVWMSCGHGLLSGTDVIERVKLKGCFGRGRQCYEVDLQLLDYQFNSTGDISIWVASSNSPFEAQPFRVAETFPRLNEPVSFYGWPGQSASSQSIAARVSDTLSLTTGSDPVDFDANYVVPAGLPSIHGMSGGPALNSAGEVVGVLSQTTIGAGQQTATFTGLPAIHRFIGDGIRKLANNQSSVTPQPSASPVPRGRDVAFTQLGGIGSRRYYRDLGRSGAVPVPVYGQRQPEIQPIRGLYLQGIDPNRYAQPTPAPPLRAVPVRGESGSVGGTASQSSRTTDASLVRDVQSLQRDVAELKSANLGLSPRSDEEIAAIASRTGLSKEQIVTEISAISSDGLAAIKADVEANKQDSDEAHENTRRSGVVVVAGLLFVIALIYRVLENKFGVPLPQVGTLGNGRGIA